MIKHINFPKIGWRLKSLLPALLFALLLILFCCSCGKAEASQKTLRQQGMDLVNLMAQMAASEEYGTIIGADNSSFERLLQGIKAGEYTSPTAVYELTPPSMQQFLSIIGDNTALDGLPDTLKNMLNSRTASLLANQFNAQVGSDALALSSLYAAEKTFVSNELETDLIYLYFFDSGYPITVTFRGGEDHTVKATGNFVLTKDLDASSIDQIKQALALFGLGCEIRLLEE